MVVDSGYSSASAVKDALSHVDDDQFALARITVKSTFDETKIDQLLAGEGLAHAKRRERWRTRAGGRYAAGSTGNGQPQVGWRHDASDLSCATRRLAFGD